MKRNKVIYTSVIFILILITSLFFNKVSAKQMSPSLYFGITELRESGMGYSIGDPNTNGTTGSAAKIWDIVQYSSASSNNPIRTNVYCVKAGVGFTSGTGNKGKQEYNLSFDMYNERTVKR